MELEKLRKEDALLGLNDAELRSKLIEAIAPIIDLVRASKIFKDSFASEVKEAVSAEGDTAENLLAALAQDVDTMRIEEAILELNENGFDPSPNRLPDFIVNIPWSQTDPCSSCPNFGKGPCNCTLPYMHTITSNTPSQSEFIYHNTQKTP